jgi:glycopeptide antibiotics resistance protein
MFKKPLLPGLIWTMFIALLTLSPGNYIPKITTLLDWLGPDKLVHLFLYGTYSYLLLEGFAKQHKYTPLQKQPVFISLLIGIVFAFLTEAMQKYVIPGRNGNLYDFLANTIGCFLGYISWRIIGRNGKKNLLSSKNYN